MQHHARKIVLSSPGLREALYLGKRIPWGSLGVCGTLEMEWGDGVDIGGGGGMGGGGESFGGFTLS